MKENIDYKLIPADVDNEQAWEIRILTGEFVETVIRYGNVSIDGPADCIKFSFLVSSSPIEDLTAEDQNLQITAGNILGDIIENQLENGSILLEDK